MNNATQLIVNKAWNFAHVLRDDGLSYMAYYTEQIAFLLFQDGARQAGRHGLSASRPRASGGFSAK